MLGNKDFAKMVSSGSADLANFDIRKASSSSASSEKVRFDLNQIKQWDREAAAVQSSSMAFRPRGLSKKSKWNAAMNTDNDNNEEESGNSVVKKNINKGKGTGALYRDRASERRKEEAAVGEESIKRAISLATVPAAVTVNEEQDIAQRIAQLDAEQTKFIGGDLEHTHLVKGLDYALLHKVRQETASAAATTSSSSHAQKKGAVDSSDESDDDPEQQTVHADEEESEAVKRTKRIAAGEVEVSSILGRKLKSLLFPVVETEKHLDYFSASLQGARTAGIVLDYDGGKKRIDSSLLQQQQPQQLQVHPLDAGGNGISMRQANNGIIQSNAAKVLARTVFEFETSVDSLQDIPTLVSKSKKEISDADSASYYNYSMDSALYGTLCSLFSTSSVVPSFGKNGLLSAQERRKRQQRIQQQQQQQQQQEESAAVAAAVVIVGGCGTTNDKEKINAAGSGVKSKPKIDLFDSIYDDDVPIEKYVPGEVSSSVDGGRDPIISSSSAAVFGSGSSNHSNNGIDRSASSSNSANTDSCTTAAATAATTTTTTVVRDMNIFGDIYVGGVGDPASSSSSTAAGGRRIGIAHGHPSNVTESNSISTSEDPYAELLKPVNAILSAEARKEQQISQQREQERIKKEQNQKGDFFNREMAIDKNVVHRDVFATATASKPVLASTTIGNQGKKAEVFGAMGTYNLYPENTNGYEDVDSDAEEEDGDDDGRDRGGGGGGRMSGVKRNFSTASGLKGKSSSSSSSSASNTRGGNGSGWYDAGATGGGKDVFTARKTKISTPWNRPGGGGK